MRVYLQGSNDLRTWTTIKVMTFNGPGIVYDSFVPPPSALTDTREVEYTFNCQGIFTECLIFSFSYTFIN